jgi:hypothetical protein
MRADTHVDPRRVKKGQINELHSFLIQTYRTSCEGQEVVIHTCTSPVFPQQIHTLTRSRHTAYSYHLLQVSYCSGRIYYICGHGVYRVYI